MTFIGRGTSNSPNPQGPSAREREVSPTPFIPTRRVVVHHSSCTISGVSDGFEMRGVIGQLTALIDFGPGRSECQLRSKSYFGTEDNMTSQLLKSFIANES